MVVIYLNLLALPEHIRMLLTTIVVTNYELPTSKIVDKRIKFYSQNTDLLPPKSKSSFRHLKQGIHEYVLKYV